MKHTTGCKITDTSSGLKVYGPVLLEVNIQDKAHASYLEGHVANYKWKSFITQDASDHDVLIRQLKQYDIPVLNYVGDKCMRREPFNITMEMQEVGIYSRLDQVFEAPPAVKDILISQANFGHSLTDADLDVGDIERLRSQKEKHMKDIEGTGEALKMLLTTQRQLEDEAAKFHRIKEEMLHEKRKQDKIN